jgi:hypothetical protein
MKSKNSGPLVPRLRALTSRYVRHGESSITQHKCTGKGKVLVRCVEAPFDCYLKFERVRLGRARKSLFPQATSTLNQLRFCVCIQHSTGLFKNLPKWLFCGQWEWASSLYCSLPSALLMCAIKTVSPKLYRLAAWDAYHSWWRILWHDVFILIRQFWDCLNRRTICLRTNCDHWFGMVPHRTVWLIPRIIWWW